jgi:DNA-binding response OmpR family regulator
MIPQLARLVGTSLQHGRFETRNTTEPAEYRRILRDWRPQLVILDLDQQARFVRLAGGTMHGQPPLLGLTRKRDTALKLRSFEDGVDDLIEVPFTLDEIVARSIALVRRTHGIAVPVVRRIRLDSLEVDLLDQRVRVDGKTLSLTVLEQALLYLLASNAGSVLSRDDILTSIWGEDFDVESNVVDRHVRSLRAKLGDEWQRPNYIETIPGQGYRFVAHDATGQRPRES